MAFLFAGCGGDDEPEGEPEAGPTTTAVVTETVNVATEEETETSEETTTGEETTTEAGSFKGGHFKSPSGNIGCGAYLGPTNDPLMSCDLRELDTEPPARPKECPNSTNPGNSFHMSGRGRAHWTCNPPGQVDDWPRMTLVYGRLWERGPFTCRSLAIGVRCWNLDGHGFFLSRERQRVF